MIGVDNRLLKRGSEVGVDRMNDVSVCSVGVLPRGHNDEISVSCINDLDVVHSETVVEGDGNDRLHGSLFKEFSDFNVRDLHLVRSFLC